MSEESGIRHNGAKSTVAERLEQRRKERELLKSTSSQSNVAAVVASGLDGAQAEGFLARLEALAKEVRVSGKISESLMELEAFVASNIGGLPAYEKRRCEDLMKTLRDAGGAEKAKRAFSFKPTTAPPTQKSTAAASSDSAAVNPSKASSTISYTEASPEISDQLVVLTPEKLQPFRGAKGCDVCTLAPLPSATFADMRECRVFVGPVSGSVSFRNLVDCEIHCISRQIRIHDCKRCVFRLSSSTPPIIEGCERLVFGSRCFTYPGLSEAMLVTTPDLSNGEGVRDAWREVKDFSWLKTSVPSPNWRAWGASEESWPLGGGAGRAAALVRVDEEV